MEEAQTTIQTKRSMAVPKVCNVHLNKQIIFLPLSLLSIVPFFWLTDLEFSML